MKKAIVFIIVTMSFLTAASVKTIYGEYTYVYSDSETLVDARRKCFDLAKKDALEKFATYISSESVVRNYMTEKDEIVSSTMGIIKNIQTVEEKTDRANSTVYYKLSAEIDEDEVLEMIRQKHGSAEMKSKISDFIQTAQSAEADNRIGEALRYYYWSLMLQKSDPAGSSLRIENFDSRLLSIALPEKIGILFSKLEFKISDISESRNYKGIEIEVKSGNMPVKNLDFIFYNGEEWSRSVKVINGRAKVEFYGDAASIVAVLLLNIEYRYQNLAQHNDFVNTAFSKTDHVPFQSSSVRLPITAMEKKPVVKEDPVKTETVVEEKKTPTTAAERLAELNRRQREPEKAHVVVPEKRETPKAPSAPAVTRTEPAPYGIKQKQSTEMSFNFSYTASHGDFAESARFGSFIDELWTQGFTSFGVGVGMIWGLPVQNTGFRINIGFDIVITPVDEKKYEEWALGNSVWYSGQYYQGSLEIVECTYEGTWVNFPLYVGLGYRHFFNRDTSVSFSLNTGLNLSVGPEYYLRTEDWWNSTYNQWWYSYYEYTLPDPSVSFMFSAGLGFTYSVLEITGKYYSLGVTKMDYDNAVGDVTTMERDVQMFVATFGFFFRL